MKDPKDLGLTEEMFLEAAKERYGEQPTQEQPYDTEWLAELYAKKHVLGPIGFNEQLKKEWTGSELAQKIPFTGDLGLETKVVRDAVERLQKGDYSKPQYDRTMHEMSALNMAAQSGFVAGPVNPQEYYHKFSEEEDKKIVEDYLKKLYEADVRGYTMGGRVAQGVSALPTWMTEFALSGGLAKLGSVPAKQAAARLLGKYAQTTAGKAAGWGAGLVGGAAARATIPFAERTLQGAEERRLEGEMGHRPKEGFATSLARSWGDQFVEALSEETGEGLNTAAGWLLNKTNFGSKFLKALQKSWMKATGGESGEFFRQIATKAGYHNLLSEMGEERVGTILREAFDIEGRGGNWRERVAQGLLEDMKNLPAEMITLSVPMTAQFAAGGAGRAYDAGRSRLQIRDLYKQGQEKFKKGLLAEDGAEVFAAAYPDEARRISQMEKPSRKDFEEILGAKGWSAAERSQLSKNLRDFFRNEEETQAFADILSKTIAEQESRTEPLEESKPTESEMSNAQQEQATTQFYGDEQQFGGKEGAPTIRQEAGPGEGGFGIPESRPPEEPRAEEKSKGIKENPPAMPQEQTVNPNHTMADWTAQQLKEGMSFDNRTVQEMSQEVYGKSAGMARDAYDSMEAGMNKHIAETDIDFSKPEESLDRLMEIGNQMPRQERRDETQVEYQQFSTPPAEAFLAVYASGIKPNMTALEPSAGTGNLATLMRKAGAKVHANEIDPRRADLLRYLGFPVTEIDAEQLDNLMDPSMKFDVVVMNPPFSATGGRVKGHDTRFGARHVEQALRRLNPGGRLVAIVGQGMAADKPAFSDWWKKIQNEYNVRANIGIDGKYYGKFGTTFGNQIVIIDKTGPTADPGQIITGEKLDPKQALELLKPIAEEDVYGRTRTAQIGTGEGYTPAGKPAQPRTKEGTGSAGGTPIGKSTGRRGESGRTEGGAGGGTGHVPVFGPGEQQPAGTEQRPEKSTGVRTDKTTDQPEESKGEVGVDTERSGGQAEGPEEPEQADREKRIAKQEEGTPFSEYIVQKAIVPGAQKHPADIVESTVLASVEPPDVKYKHSIPQEVISEGRLSDLQMETVIYAGQAHQVVLPNGKRKGYWIGDGTGVGKGREIYGIIYDNYMKGKKKAVHISLSHQLAVDAKRDAEAVGLPMELIHIGSDYSVDKPIELEEGVVFTTYGLLAGEWDEGRRRLKQLTEWLGEGFDGVIAFDESHAMKNALEEEAGRAARVKGTARGNMGLELQQMFPKAKIVYASATGATLPRNLAPYERLNLWGENTPFPSFTSFLEAMKQGGVGAMEMLARELKMLGLMCSRSISYKGVNVDPLQHRMTPQEILNYNRVAELWQHIQRKMDEASENARMGKRMGTSGIIYSIQQRFFLKFMMAMSVPDVIKSVEKDLSEGKSAVISLYSTGESSQKRAAATAAETGEEIDTSPREMLVNMVERYFPVQQYVEKTDPQTGNIRRIPLVDAAGNPVLNRENIEMRDKLLSIIADIELPPNPLDALINHFGPNNVAEITGRKHRVEHGKLVRRQIKGVSVKNLNDYETKLFQNGQKRIAIISGAGSTGISLHSDKNARNKQRRVFYALELSWSADQTMQSNGRVHRAFQEVPPIIRPTSLDLAGHMRLVSAVSRRLASLGAVTRGERSTLSSDMFSIEDITDDYGKAALDFTYKELMDGAYAKEGLGYKTAAAMGILDKNGNIRETFRQDVDRFLNRIMVLKVSEQNALFDKFFENYQAYVNQAKEEGAFDFGVGELRARNIKVVGTPEILNTEPHSGGQTKLYTLVGEVDVDRMTWQRVNGNYSHRGFYVNTSSGHVYGVDSHSSPLRVGTHVIMTSVRGNRHSVEMKDFENRSKWKAVDTETAERLWNEQLKQLPLTEEKKYHMLAGPVLIVWDKVMGEGECPLKKSRVMRAKLRDGSSLIGFILPSKEVPKIRQRFGLTSNLKNASAEEIYSMIDGGAIIELDNGWRVRKSIIAGDSVVEVEAPVDYHPELLKDGFQQEIIYHKKRVFVHEDEAADVLSKLFEHHKPIRDMTAGYMPETSRLKSTGIKASQKSANVFSIPTEEEPQEGAVPTGAMEIYETIRKLFDIPIRSGKVRGNSAGVYKNFPEVIRAKGPFYGSLYVLSHEVGHHIDKTAHIRIGLNKQAIAELENLDYDKSKRRPTEGFAEFIRIFWTEGDQAAKKSAPKFYKFFVEEWLPSNPEYAKKIDKVKEMISNYRKQGAKNRGLKQISFTGKPAKPTGIPIFERFMEEAKSFYHAMHAAMKDEGHFLDLFTQEAVKLGLKTEKGERPYDLFLALTQSGATHANEAIENGVFRMSKGQMDKIGPSLKEVFKDIKPEEYEDFVLFVYSRHAIEAWENGHNPGITLEDARANYENLANERFEAAAETLTEYNNALIEMLCDVGVISKKTRDRILSKWKTYIPLYRVHESMWRSGLGGKRLLNVPEPLKSRKFGGSGREILDPIQSTIERTIRFYERAAQQVVINSMVETASQVEGMGRWIEEVPPALEKTAFGIDEILGQLTKIGVDTESIRKSIEDGTIDKRDMLFIFRPNYNYRGNQPIARVLVNGKPKLFQFDRELFRAINGMNYFQLPFVIDFFFGKSTRLIKTGATGINIAFGEKNIIRDFGSYLAQKEHGRILDPGAWLGIYVNSEIQRILGGEKNPYVELWQQFGGELAQSLGLDRKKIVSKIQDVIADSTERRIWNFVKNPLEAAKTIISITEVGPRLSEFSAVLKKYGYTQEKLSDMIREGKRPPRHVLVEAINAANDVTTNFKRLGWLGKWLNRIIPYWNAPQEGTSKYLRTWKANPKKAALYTVFFVAARILYWLQVKDEDWYKEAPAWLKYGSWTISLDGKPVFRFPVFHLWTAPAIGVEALLNRMYQDDPDAVKDWAKQTISETGLPVQFSDLLPSGAKQIIETTFNWDFFRKQPIVTESTMRMAPSDQYTEYNTELMKWAGKVMGVSPALMEHFVDSITGGLFRNIVVPAENITVKGKGIKETVKGLLTEGFTLRRDYSESINEFYREKTETEQQYNSAKKHGEIPEEMDYRHHLLQEYASLMGEIRAQLDGIEDRDVRFDGEKYIIGLARHALGKDELPRYPNPLRNFRNLPKEFKKPVEDYLERKVYQLTSPPSKDNVESRRRAKKILQENGLEYKDLKALLYQTAKSRGMKTQQAENGKPTSYGERVKRLKD